MCFYMHISVKKIMRKSHREEDSTPVVSLAAKWAKGAIYNWVDYLCRKYLSDCRVAEEEVNHFHYAWLLLLISLMAWRELKE